MTQLREPDEHTFLGMAVFQRFLSLPSGANRSAAILAAALLTAAMGLLPSAAHAAVPAPVTVSLTPASAPQAAVFSKDGTRAFISGAGTSAPIQVFNLNTKTVIKTLNSSVVGSGPFGMVLSPDGSKLYVSNGSSNSVRVIDAATYAQIGDIMLNSPSKFLKIAPDGKTLFATNGFKLVIAPLHESGTSVGSGGAQSVDLFGNGSITSLDLSPDGSQIYATSDTYGSIAVFNTSTMAKTQISLLQTLNNDYPESNAYQVVFASNTSAFVSAGSRALYRIDAGVSSQLRYTLNTLQYMQVSADKTKIFAAHNATANVFTFNASTGANSSPASYSLPNLSGSSRIASPDWLAVSPDGSYVLTIDNIDNTASIVTLTEPRTISFTGATSFNLEFGATQTVQATVSAGDSEGTITYSVGDSTACTVNSASGLVTITSGSGTCVISASVTSGSTYGAATTNTPVTITPQKAPRTLSFATTAYTLPYGATQTVTAVPVPASSPVDGTLTYSANGGCTVDTSTGLVKVTSSTQQCTVSASITEGNNYLAAETGTNVVINSTRKNITVRASSSSVPFGDPFSTNALATGQLVGTDTIDSTQTTFTYVGNNGTTYGPTTVEPVNAGTYTVTPSDAVFSTGSASDYNITYATGTVTISKVSRTLSFATTSYNKTFGQTQTITATPSAGDGTVTYSAGSSTACTVDPTSGLVTVTAGTGTCSISATIAEGTNHLTASTTTPVTITVSPRPITVTASSPSVTVGGAVNPTFTLSSGTMVGADSISTVTYNYSSASYPSSTSAPTAIGTYTVTPSTAVFSAGSSGDYVITYATGTLTISAKASRTISFAGTSTTLQFGDTQTVSAVVSAGSTDGTVSYSAGSSTACVVGASTGVIEVTSGSGTCSVTATITEGSQYLSATTLVPVTVTVEPRALTLTANNLTVAYGGAVAPSYSVSSGTLHGSDALSGVNYRYAGTGSTTYASSLTAPTGGGTYSITPSAAVFSSGSAANYAITYVAGSLSIIQDREPTVTMTLAAPVGARVLGATLTYSASGMQSSASYQVVVRSSPQVLSSGVMAGGSVSGSTSIPTNLEAGWHTLTFSSTAPDGSRFTESMYFKVSANGTLLLSTTVMPAELALTGVDTGWMPAVSTLALLLGLALFTVVRFRRRGTH